MKQKPVKGLIRLSSFQPTVDKIKVIILSSQKGQNWNNEPNTCENYFTTAYSVAWPVCGNEAGCDLVFIQTSLLSVSCE